MSKLHYKVKTFYEPIYDYHIRFIKTNDRKRVFKNYNLDLNEFEAVTLIDRITTKDKVKHYLTIIWCRDIKDKNFAIGVIAHESEHAAGLILEAIKSEPQWVSEPKAYLTEYIARELSKFIFTK